MCIAGPTWYLLWSSALVREGRVCSKKVAMQTVKLHYWCILKGREEGRKDASAAVQHGSNAAAVQHGGIAAAVQHGSTSREGIALSQSIKAAIICRRSNKTLTTSSWRYPEGWRPQQFRKNLPRTTPVVDLRARPSVT